MMKKRTKGFLAEDKIDHNGEVFAYIRELHEYLWRFVRAEIPSASGNLDDFVDDALTDSEQRRYDCSDKDGDVKVCSMPTCSFAVSEGDLSVIEDALITMLYNLRKRRK